MELQININESIEGGIIVSQVGYDIGRKKIAYIKGSTPNYLKKETTFAIIRISDDEKVITNQLEFWGEKWDAYWWKLDFTDLDIPGNYYITIKQDGEEVIISHKEIPVRIGVDMLWNKTWYNTSLGQLNIREALCYKPEGGWKDCGSPLQEVSSHIIMINALCDLLEFAPNRLSEEDQYALMNQIIVGTDYVVACQDKATDLSLGDGPMVHEIRENHAIVTGNQAKGAMILARTSRLLKGFSDEKSKLYLQRAIKVYEWIIENGPIIHSEDSDYFAITHGAPYDMTTPPNEWMTRDLVSMCWASIELTKCGENNYKEKAIYYANKVMGRQVPKDKDEEGLFGHFYTFDSCEFTEKANLHCGAWNVPYKNYNQGAHFPHYIIPLIEMTKIWGDHKLSNHWMNAIKNFAYGYFIPASKQSPFSILPAGYYHGIGLLYFSGWYHAHNKIYGYAASLAMEFYALFEDQIFEDIATANLQWIAGLNVGQGVDCLATSQSMIVGVGNQSVTDWDNLTGTIVNGWDSFTQFSLERPSAEKDLPTFLCDEGGIHHCAGWVSGLSQYVRECKSFCTSREFQVWLP